MNDCDKELLHAAARRILPGFSPRTQQDDLFTMIATTMAEGGHRAVRAPVGVGKSFAYLVPAFFRAAGGMKQRPRERTLISTSGLMLQQQLRDKDCPQVADAVDDMLGVRTSFAVLKGRSNYVCLCKTFHSACGFVQLNTETTSKQALVKALGKYLEADGDEHAQFYIWAMNSPHRDRDECSLSVASDDEVWSRVSAADPNECWNSTQLVSKTSSDDSDDDEPQEPPHPLGDTCGVALALQRAGSVDVVITNHASLGIQAATESPVILGRKFIGGFDHLVIDEAHDLPSAVRNASAEKISYKLVDAVVSKFDESIDDIRNLAASKDLYFDDAVQRTKYVGEDEDRALVASVRLLNSELFSLIRSLGVDDYGMDLDDEAHQGAYAPLKQASALAAAIQNARMALLQEDFEPGTWQAQVYTQAGSLVSRLDAAAVSQQNLARWFSIGNDGEPLLQFSGIRAGAPLQRGVYGFKNQRHTGLRSVVAVSGTLEEGYAEEAGLECEVESVGSPFEQAYRVSALYIPEISMQVRDEICSFAGGTSKLDTGSDGYIQWCVDQIEALVRANDGAAMVIAASNKNAEIYWQHLVSVLGPERVFSQTRGQQQAISSWISATNRGKRAVIVGSRKLTTGVDVKGDGNTLVIMDRPPVSPNNPLMDARKRALGEQRFDSYARVYVNDAAVVMAQGAGRLIRDVSDSGMVAVLDPRLLLANAEKLVYSSVSRRLFREWLSQHPWGAKPSTLTAACHWLEQHRERRAVLSAAASGS